MNISHDFVQRFERVKEDFKKSMFRDLCRQVDAWFAPLLAELKAGVEVIDAGGCTTITTITDSEPPSLVDVVEDTGPDNASSHFSLSTSLLDHHHHQSSENGLIINSNDHLLGGSDPFWGDGGNVVEPSKLIESTDVLSGVVVTSSASSAPVDIIGSATSSLTADGTVSSIKEELASDHEDNMDDLDGGEAFGEDEGSTNCDCSECRSEDDEEIEGELFGTKKSKVERQLSDEIVFDESTSPLDANFYEIPGSDNEPASLPSLTPSKKKKSSIHFCKESTCLASFRKHCQLLAHRQRSHYSTRFRCKWPGCKSDFASRSNIYRHLRTTHLSLEQQEQTDGEPDLKHLMEVLTVKTPTTTSSISTTPLEPPSSTLLGSSSGSSTSSSVPNTQKCYRCKWPMCDYTGEHSGNITRHIRTQHFQLPRTVREQRDKNILDNRNPYAFVEVFLKPIATTTGKVITPQKSSDSSSVSDSLGGGGGGGDSKETASLTYGSVLTDSGPTVGSLPNQLTATKNSATGATDMYTDVFSQTKEEKNPTSCAKVSTGKKANELEVMTTLAATAVAAAAAAVGAGGGGNSSSLMDYSDNDDPAGTYHF